MQRDSRFSTLSLNTPFSRPDVTPAELDFLGRLAPHVRRAVHIGDLFGYEAVGTVALETALEMLSVAVLVIDESTTVLHANNAAREVLAKGSPLACVKGKLRSASQEVQNALLAAVARIAAGEANLGPHGIGIPLLHDAPHATALAHILPLKLDSVRQAANRNATAVLFITSASAGPQLAAETVAGLYGLTPTEARVMIEVASGRNRQAAARALGMAPSTVKSHLERVFAKTGTSSQAELTLLHARLMPPVAARART
jgi:DNA-binding CsgD family transcriptional regulator